MDMKTLETQFESHLSTWREDEKAALELLKLSTKVKKTMIGKILLYVFFINYFLVITTAP